MVLVGFTLLEFVPSGKEKPSKIWAFGQGFRAAGAAQTLHIDDFHRERGPDRNVRNRGEDRKVREEVRTCKPKVASAKP